MKNLNLTDKILEKEISQAREAAKLADFQEPRAQSVHYDAQEKQIVLKLKNGTTFLFPPNLIQGLTSASVTSESKTKAARNNGKKGGRPKNQYV